MSVATLSSELNISCPSCDHRFDLFEDDCDAIYTPPIFNNKWDDLVGELAYCPECEHEFEISQIDY